MTNSPEMRAPSRSSCGEAVMGGTEPVCRAHRRWNDAGSALFHRVRQGYMAPRHSAFMAAAAEPPAHCRLVRATILCRGWRPTAIVPLAGSRARAGGRGEPHLRFRTVDI